MAQKKVTGNKSVARVRVAGAKKAAPAGKRATPAKPTKTSRPTKLTKPTKTAKPVQSTQPAKTAESAKPTRPIIGISCSLGDGNPDFGGGLPFEFLKRDYHQAVERAGGVPLPIVNSGREETLRTLINLADGLLLTGGDDLDPSWWGEEIQYPGYSIHKERDIVEMTLLKLAQERQLPVLAICRGHQLVNVAMRGSLYQDLERRRMDGLRTLETHRRDARRQPNHHEVELVKGSRIERITGKRRLAVNSSHHQLARVVPECLRVTAHADDGAIEGLEWPQPDWWLVTVQWHPEAMGGDPASRKLFEEFIAAARERNR